MKGRGRSALLSALLASACGRATSGSGDPAAADTDVPADTDSGDTDAADDTDTVLLDAGSDLYPTTNWRTLDMSSETACGVVADCGAVWCDGTADWPKGGGHVDVAVGGDEWYGTSVCAAGADGTLSCHGWAADGAPTVPVEAFDVGDFLACAIIGGEISCWGLDAYLAGLTATGPYTAVGVGYDYVVALGADGALEGWGLDYEGGHDPPAGTYSRLAVGSIGACAIDATDGHVACWGSDAWGRKTETPAGDFARVDSGYNSNCAVAPDGTVQCWGYLDSAPAGAFVDVQVGLYTACALSADGAATCWSVSPGPLLPSAPPADACDTFAYTVCDDGTGRYTTLQDAVDAASWGDEITVCAGTFDGVTLDKAVTIVGAGAGATILDGGASTAVVVEQEARLERLSFAGSGDPIALEAAGDAVKLVDVEVNGVGSGVEDVFVVYGYASLDIDGAVLSDLDVASIVTPGGAVTLDEVVATDIDADVWIDGFGSGLTVRNSVFARGSAATAVIRGLSSTDCSHWGSPATLTWLTMEGIDAPVAVDLAVDPDMAWCVRARLRDSIVTGTTGIGVRTDCLAEVSYADVWNNGTDLDTCGGETHVLSADPLFVGPSAGDWRLGAGSPASDVGDPSWIRDVDGTPPDLGAFGGPDAGL